MLFRSLKAVNGSASDAIMIGDRKFDILGAKAHSMASVGVTFGYAEENELERAGADYIIHDIKELLDLQI